MTKIAFVIDVFEPSTSGTIRHLSQLIEGLPRDRFCPYLCLLGASDSFVKSFDLCPLYVVGIRSWRDPRLLLKLYRFARFLRKERVDIVQTHYRDANIAGIVAGRLGRTRAIVSTRRNQGYWYNKFERLILRFLNPLANAFLTNSVSTKEWLEKAENVTAERIHVISNCIEPGFDAVDAEKAREEYREELGASNGTVVIGVVANLRSVKRIDVFLRAAKIVNMQYPDTSFVIVGDGDLSEELRGLANQLGIGDRTLFLGRRHDVYELLRAFDVGVLSSSSESFSNSLLEYMAAGIPVVSTNVGGCQETIETGWNGYVVPVGDFQAMAGRLLDLLGNRDNLHLMGRRNREKVEREFMVSRIVGEYERFYDSF